MKYFGKRSLSSVLSVILDILWYVVLVAAIGGFIAGVVFIAVFPEANSAIFDHSGAGINNFKDISMDDWNDFMAIPLFLRIFMLPYFAAIMVFLLLIIRNCRMLFRNFKEENIFTESNVRIISKISRLLIVFSILTFKIFLIVVSLLLLLVCEIFKSGKALQEEHDLTV